MAYSGKDYLGDKKLSQELADKIYKYWVKKVPTAKVWVEPFYMGETKLWQVRNNLTFTYK
jgi:hypothetical protein|tara:strand:- start:184 stop:363 length:180 start_codon:yes stop_codon:yes gene_type:complete